MDIVGNEHHANSTFLCPFSVPEHDLYLFHAKYAIIYVRWYGFPSYSFYGFVKKVLGRRRS